MNIRRVHEVGVYGRWRAFGPMGLLLAATLMPKCPLCIGVYLTALGISATVATLVAPWLLPLVWTALAVVALYVGVRLVGDRTPTARTRPSGGALDGHCRR